MTRRTNLRFDEIGYWTEVKLDIVKAYAAAYSAIMAARKNPTFYHVYIDAFSGAGLHVSKTTGEFIVGSPMNALYVNPPFKEYHFIDLDKKKVAALKDMAGEKPNIYYYEGDCNPELLGEVFPKIKWDDYRRALCLLDPYGLHLHWDVVEKAGKMKSIEIFLNFPVTDMNRNVLWRNPDSVALADIERMNSFWGGESWRDIAYTDKGNLFGWKEKTDNETVAEGYRKRLKEVAGFEFVPKPLPMRNSQGGIVYYLFFASQNKTGGRIVGDIFNKYRKREVR